MKRPARSISVQCCLMAVLVLTSPMAFGSPAQGSTDNDYVTYPPFGLEKVRALIAKTERDADLAVLKNKDYAALSLEEKFTYNMIHGEVDTQNCDAYLGPQIPHPETKIFGRVDDGGPTDNQGWSARQRQFFRRNRSKVVDLLRRTVRTRRTLRANVLSAIAYVDAYELIPEMLSAYRQDHNNFILSHCLNLMRQGKYKPFLASVTYRKLYGRSSNDQSYIEASPANIALTERRAMAYYRLRMQGRS